MRLLLITTLLSFTLCAIGQDGKYQLGAASAGIGGSSLTVSNAWSIFNNVGAMGALDETTAFGSYQNRYNVPGFQVIGGGFVHSMDFATTGVSYYAIGDQYYNQQRATLAIANKIQMVSMGIALNVVQFHAEGLDTRRRLALEFGGVAQIIPELAFGAHIYNLRESNLLPTVMKAGLSYRPSDQLMLNLETEKELGFNQSLKAGLQYQLIEPLYFRTGISTKPFRSAFGFGVVITRLFFDYAYTSNPDLGVIHEISLSYKFRGE